MFDREFLQLQKAEEERIQRQNMDEEFARSLQNDFQPASNFNHPTNSAPSAFDRMSGAHQPSSNYSSAAASTSNLPRNGQSSGRKLPWPTSSSNTFGNSSVRPTPQSMTSGVKQEGQSGFSPYASMQNSSLGGFKPEPSHSRTMPGSFRDDSTDASDSDLEIIAPSEFRDNGRRNHTPIKPSGRFSSNAGFGTSQPPMQHPSFSPEAQTAGNATLRRLEQPAAHDALKMAMFGKQPMPQWMNTIGSSQSPTPSTSYSGSIGMASGKVFETAAVGQYGSGGNYVYPSAYGSAANGVYLNTSLQSPGPGLGYTVNNLPNYNRNPFGFSQGLGPAPLDDTKYNPLAEIIARSGNNQEELSEYLNLNGNMAGQLDYIMNDPRKTNQEIQELLENIRPDADLPPEDREGTPEGLVYPLVSGPDSCAFGWILIYPSTSTRSWL